MRTPTTSRRQFLQATGLSVAATSLAGVRALAQPRLPGPPEKKLGFAIVGLGSLSINQILPAFAHCRHARVTALVSGDAAKAKTLATACSRWSSRLAGPPATASTAGGAGASSSSATISIQGRVPSFWNHRPPRTCAPYSCPLIRSAT